MTQLLEAEVNYLYKIEGARQTIHPAGYGARTAERKPARGRERDLLFVAVVLHPRSPASAARSAPLEKSAIEAEAVELANVAARTYFSVAGSVTSAMRETGQAVNIALLQWNLRVARQAINAQGSLTLAVLRGSDLYLAQAGSAVAAVISPDELLRFPSEPREQRPLGVSQTADLVFNLCSVKAGDYFVAGTETWDDPTLGSFSDLTLDMAVDRLAERAGPEACGLIGRFVPSGTVQAAAGEAGPSSFDRLKGLLPPARSSSAAQRQARSAAKPAAPLPEESEDTPVAPAIEPEPVMAPPASPEPEADLGDEWAEDEDEAMRRPVEEEEGDEPAELALEPEPEPEVYDEDDDAPVLETLTRPAAAVSPARSMPPRRHTAPLSTLDEPGPAVTRSTPARSSRPSTDATVRPNPLAPLAASVQGSLAALGTQIQSGLGELFRRTLPEGSIAGRDFRLPISLMAVIAIGLPLIVGLLVASTYIRRGSEQQYTGFLEQAQTEVSLARTAPDPLTARPHWASAVDWLNRAERVRPGTAEVAVLQAEALSFLDTLELATRLNFQPLVAGGFGRDVNLTNVVVSGSEVYALDPTLGRVFRAMRIESGAYVVDEAFNKCASGPIGQYELGPIVDMTWLAGPTPVGSDTLIVMDGAGTLAFCPPDGSSPLASQLVPPDIGWTGPRSIALYGNGLYVLDPPGNQIWKFNRPGGEFTERPSRYFAAVSFDLSQAVDLAIANGEIFILFGDGRVMICNRTLDDSDAACVAEATFSDTRQGHAPSGVKLDDLQKPFALIYDPPPEPSLYLADSGTGSIYQLSLKLVLQRQFLPASPPSGPIAAVSIGNRKELYLAVGDNLYVADRP